MRILEYVIYAVIALLILYCLAVMISCGFDKCLPFISLTRFGEWLDEMNRWLIINGPSWY